jgi:hypothetical protein
VYISASHTHIPARPLTLNRSIPKMALDSELHIEAAILAKPTDHTPRNLYRAIATDIHFWIPFSVLLGGVFLLDKLR